MYRIRIESMDGQDHIDEEIREIECSGFAIIVDNEKSSQVILHNVSSMDIATGIAFDDSMMGAAIIAKAMREAHEIDRESDPLAGLLKSLKG